MLDPLRIVKIRLADREIECSSFQILEACAEFLWQEIGVIKRSIASDERDPRLWRNLGDTAAQLSGVLQEMEAWIVEDEHVLNAEIERALQSLGDLP